MSKPYKHIAVFLRGHMRTYRMCLPQSFKFYESISDNVDYYLTTWNIKDYVPKYHTEIFEGQNLVTQKYIDISSQYNGDIGPTYLMYQVLPYKRKRERELGYKYDLIFDTRPDVIPKLVSDKNFVQEQNLIQTHNTGFVNNELILEDFCLAISPDIFEFWCDRFINVSRVNCQVEPLLWARDNDINIRKVDWYTCDIIRPNNNRAEWDMLDNETKIQLCFNQEIPLEDYSCSVSEKVRIK